MLYMQLYKLDIKILLSVAFSGPNIGFQFAFLWFYLSQANAQYVIDQMATRKSERLIFFFSQIGKWSQKGSQWSFSLISYYCFQAVIPASA